MTTGELKFATSISLPVVVSDILNTLALTIDGNVIPSSSDHGPEGHSQGFMPHATVWIPSSSVVSRSNPVFSPATISDRASELSVKLELEGSSLESAGGDTTTDAHE